jgi:hypothetical protein
VSTFSGFGAEPSITRPRLPRTPQELDEAIGRERAVRPPTVDTQRSVPRMSVAELNAADLDDLRERFLKSRFDDRGPVTKALDLLDAPRNAIANVIFPGAAEQAAEGGERAAFGLPRVNFSDALKGLGVENRMARGLVGFVGDVALDPLTYLGPAGWGAKVAKTGGTSVALRGAGRRALRKSIRDVAHGREARDATVAAYLRESGALTKADELRAGGRQAKDIEGELSKMVLGDPTQGVVGGALARVGGERGSRGGGLVEDIFTPRTSSTTPEQARRIEAARKVLADYGRGTGPSLKIGRGGSEVAHIPFTDATLQVPAFTPTAKAGLSALRLARDAERGRDAIEALGPAGQAFSAGLQRLREIDDAETAAVDAFRAEMRDFEASTAGALDEDALGPMDAARIRSEREAARIASVEARLAEVEDIRRGMLQTIRDTPAGAAGTLDPDTLLALGQFADEADALTARLASRTLKHRLAAQATTIADGPFDALPRILDDDPGAADELARMYQSSMEAAKGVSTAVKGHIRDVLDPDDLAMLDFAKGVLGTADDIQGASAFTSLARATGGLFGQNSAPARWALAAERAAHRTLGFPKGWVQRQLSRVQAGTTTRARQVAADEARRVAGELTAIMDEVGLPPSALDQVAQLATAMLHVAANPGAVDILRNMDGTLTHLGQALEELTRSARINASAPTPGVVLSGAWGKAQQAGLIPKLKALAESHVGRLRALGDAEVEDELLGGLLAGYVPNVATPDARRAIGSARRSPSFGPSQTGPAAGRREPFQRPRSTWVYEYLDAAGASQKFTHMDLAVLEIPAKVLADMEPAQRAKVEQMRGVIQGYLDAAQKRPPRPMSPFEANALAADGRFAHLLGGQDVGGGGLFETSVVNILAQRAAMHERAVARQNGLKILLSQGYRIDGAAFLAAKDGPFETPTGLRGEIWRDGKTGHKYLKVNGDRYRQLDREVVTKVDNALNDLLGEDIGNLVVPDMVAERYEDMARMLAPENLNTLLRLADAATGTWKAATLFHPSWPVFNVVGNTLLALSGGVNPARLGEQFTNGNFRNLIRLAAAGTDPERLRKLTFNVRGQTIGGEEMLRIMRDSGAIGSNVGAETAAQVYAAGIWKLPSQGSAVGRGMRPRLPTRETATDLSADWKHILDNWKPDSRAERVLAGAAAGGGVVRDRMARWLTGPWFRINGLTDEVMKGAVLLAYMEDGNDLATASERMLRSMFDYSDLTRIESRVFRRLAPFYAWTKNNLALQLKLLGERPAVAAATPKLFEAMDEALSGEQNVPMSLRPRWMRDALAVHIGSDPSRRFALLLGNALPSAEIAKPLAALTGGEGVEEALHYFVNQLNPVATTPMQIGTGHEFFGGRSIGTPGEADIGRLKFLGKQVRPANEIGRIADLVGQGSVGGAASRLVLGGRVQAADDERLRSSRLVEFKKQEENLRRAVRRAERQGGDSMESRVKLMLLYAEMERAGFAEDVPAWARRQNAEMVSAPGP